ncbi:hypothetical protein ACWG0P_05415 [Amedibacillus sp. YH-ame6]
MFDKYKDEYSDIHVPLDVKTKTLLKMKEEEERKHKRWKSAAFAFASLAIGCIVFFMIPKDSTNSYTEFKIGKTVEQVTVEDGNLYFEKDDGQHRTFGQSEEVTLKTIDKNSAYQFSKETIEPFTLDGYSLSSKRYYGYLEKDTMRQVEWHFAYQQDTKELNVRYISPYQEITTNSTLHGREIAIYYSEDEITQYDVYFNSGKGMYHITGNHMEQEEFLKSLTEIIKKLK